MNDKRLWIIGGVLMLAAGVLSFVSDNVAMGGALVAVGLLFLATPTYLESRSRRRH